MVNRVILLAHQGYRAATSPNKASHTIPFGNVALIARHNLEHAHQQHQSHLTLHQEWIKEETSSS